MKTFRNIALGGAIAAIAATAWAANGNYRSVLVPEYDARTTSEPAPASAQPVMIEEHVVTTRPALTVDQTLSPNETVVTETRAVRTVAAPEPRITVEQRRLSRDERIQAEVMDRIAADSRLSGKIGVVSQDSVVTLSGWTRTAGQARNAERDARSIVGVRYVQNQIRPRIGGSV